MISEISENPDKNTIPRTARPIKKRNDFTAYPTRTPYRWALACTSSQIHCFDYKRLSNQFSVCTSQLDTKRHLKQAIIFIIIIFNNTAGFYLLIQNLQGYQSPSLTILKVPTKRKWNTYSRLALKGHMSHMSKLFPRLSIPVKLIW